MKPARLARLRAQVEDLEARLAAREGRRVKAVQDIVLRFAPDDLVSAGADGNAEALAELDRMTEAAAEILLGPVPEALAYLRERVHPYTLEHFAESHPWDSALPALGLDKAVRDMFKAEANAGPEIPQGGEDGEDDED